MQLYADTPDTFDHQTRDLGHILAAHASIVWNAVHRCEHMRTALGSRDIIGQAKGMLMERYKITASDAFALLSRLSQEDTTKLVDVAHRLITPNAYRG